MPFEVGETVNSVADAILRAPIVAKVAQNPIYTAFLITFIVMLIILFTFRNVDGDEPIYVMAIRSGFWTFASTLGVLFLHNKVLVQEHGQIEKNESYDGIFNGGYDANLNILEDSIIPVDANRLNGGMP